MIKRAFLIGGVLAGVVWLTMTGAAHAQEAGQVAPAQPSSPMILNLMNQSGAIESQEKAFNEAIKFGALAPPRSAIDDWVPQPDGTVKNARTGMRVYLRNPCPPGDMEHEVALASYYQALAAAKSPRR